MPSHLWRLNDVTLRGLRRPRLEKLWLDIYPGVTAVAGDSGAGKSSLLNLLVGFERPDEGTLATGFLPAAGQLPVYWLPPGDGLWGHLSVREHLEAVQPASADSSALRDLLLDQFDLRSLAQTRPDDLSQGERARLAVTRALASQAKVLVLDEPLVHTSLSRQPVYWQRVRDWCSRFATSLVFATHDVETIAREADHLLILDEGRLAYAGPTDPSQATILSSAASDLLARICRNREQPVKAEQAFKQNPSSR